MNGTINFKSLKYKEIIEKIKISPKINIKNNSNNGIKNNKNLN